MSQTVAATGLSREVLRAAAERLVRHPFRAWFYGDSIGFEGLLAASELLGERLGQWYAGAHGLSVIAVRIGWVLPGPNLAQDVPTERGEWFRLMWLSNDDFCRLMECCVRADLAGGGFTVVNGMSRNAGMPWDLEHTRRAVGYVPRDGLVAGAGT